MKPLSPFSLGGLALLAAAVGAVTAATPTVHPCLVLTPVDVVTIRANLGHAPLFDAALAEASERMDRALAWVSTIPQEKYVLRRVVGARSLVCPLTGRQVFSWRRIGTALGADHKAVQRWHAQGVALIVAALNR